MDQSSSHSRSSNTTSSSNRADENSRGSSSSEWEVVSLSLSSHSLAASASFDTDPVRGGIGDEEEAVDVGLQSNYFMYPSLSSPSEAEDIQPPIGSSDDDDGDVPSSLITRLDVDEEKVPVAAAATTTSTSDVPTQMSSQEVLLAVENTCQEEQKKEHAKEEEHLSLVGSCTSSQMQQLLEMNWNDEPLPSGMLLRHTVDYGEHEIGSTSFLYALTPESKVASQPDFGEMGPLLGSCLSTPSSPAIVSRSNSLRLILGEEPCQNQVVEGDQNDAPDCLVKDKEDEEVQCLKRDRNLDSKFPGSDAAGTQKVELDERKGLEPLLGDGSCYEHTCEAWWKRRGILLYVQAQQASTLWSLALTAAVMGLVILGHQWQQERYQNQQLQLQLCSKDEKISHLTFQLAHLKEAMLGHRRVPVLQSSST
ncbi:hypothetical protein CY35_02G151300 [Sphagnum magellanicum]|nr:hypothetical protein CY35_02G151300 [Sphagnum magellanicum]